MPPSSKRHTESPPLHICAGTGLTPATSAPGLSSPHPHLRREWAHPTHICAGTGLEEAPFKPAAALSPARARGYGAAPAEIPAAVVVQLKAQNAALEMELRVKVRPLSTPPARLPACVSSVVCCTLHVARCVLHWKTRVRYTSQAGRQRAHARVCALRRADCGLLLCVCLGAREARARAPVRQRDRVCLPADPAQTASVASRSVAWLSCRIAPMRRAPSTAGRKASFGGLLLCAWSTG
jgi:hypothetical protein